MKLKYYLKGFGVGVLFATVILSISLLLNRQHTELTDEQIMARARELGMEMVSREEESDKETVSTKAVEDSVAPTEYTIPDVTIPDITEKETKAQEETQSFSEAESSEEASLESTRAEQSADETTVVIHIQEGMSTDTIGRLLEEAGVVESADKLLKHLEETERTRYVKAGTYEFTRGMSVEEIADRISSK